MKLHQLRPVSGSTRKRKRVGRGIAAGQGKTAGRGTKGQKARSGGKLPPYFEGGQLPFVRRLPFVRGFTNIFKVHYQPVNLKHLDPRVFPAGAEVSPDSLAAAGLIRSARKPVVLLGDGTVKRPLQVKVHRISASARAKVEAAGGTVEILPLPAMPMKSGQKR